jgi:protein-arginine kinase activator protein McsA
LAENSSELVILRALCKDIQQKLPPDPAEVLNSDLAKAIEGEQYERAAELRDQLRHLNGHNSPSAQN